VLSILEASILLFSLENASKTFPIKVRHERNMALLYTRESSVISAPCLVFSGPPGSAPQSLLPGLLCRAKDLRTLLHLIIVLSATQKVCGLVCRPLHLPPGVAMSLLWSIDASPHPGSLSPYARHPYPLASQRCQIPVPCSPPGPQPKQTL
jgi:hypothetical protein